VAADAHAGIVDKDAQTGNEAQRRLGQAVRLAHVGEIGRDTPGLDAEGAHRRDRPLDRFRFPSRDDDVGAFPRQPLGDSPPYAPRAAGDEGGLADQALLGQIAHDHITP
jgi:hypothetical protein